MMNETNTNEGTKESSKMRRVDVAVKLLFVIALAVIYFFWKCEYDPLVTVLGLIILAGASVLTYMQFHKIDELAQSMNAGDRMS